MSLLEEAYRQRVEFLQRNVTEPDVILIPMDKEYEFIGEVSVKHIPVVDRRRLWVMGMRCVFVDPEYSPNLTVCLSAEKLRGK